MKDKMDHPQDHDLAADLNDNTHQKSEGVDSSRRRLFGAGMAVPVILSMSSRTAWGGALCAPSAFNSATFSSHHPDEADVCLQPAGRSPAYWDDNPSLWLETTIKKNDAFSDYFNVGGSGLTLQQVLAASTQSIEAHAIAAILNAATGLITLGEGSDRAAAVQKVKDMFNAFLGGQAYETSPGVTVVWDDGSAFSMREFFTAYQIG